MNWHARQFTKGHDWHARQLRLVDAAIQQIKERDLFEAKARRQQVTDSITKGGSNINKPQKNSYKSGARNEA